MNLIHKTKYKNIIKTFLLGLIVSIIIFSMTYLLFDLGEKISCILSSLIGLMTFIMIGRIIIVRHNIGIDLHVTIEFLLRPRFIQYYSKPDLEDIIFKTVDYGKYGQYEKGILIFKHDKNYHKDYQTFELKNELKWFWSNFKYPNQIKNSR